MATDWTNLYQLKSLCELNNLTLPPVAARAIEAVEVANSLLDPVPVRALSLDPTQIIDYIKDVSIREHQPAPRMGIDSSMTGYRYGLEVFRAQLWDEVREQIVPDLDQLVTELRPRFDEAAAPLMLGAKKYGFRYQTSSDDVINLRDAKAAEVWFDVGQAWNAIGAIARLRVQLSELFDVSPSAGEFDNANHLNADDEDDSHGGRNWSVCFAEGDSWSMGSAFMIERRTSVMGIDWLRIARSGLKLNTPSEVRAKIAKRHGNRVDQTKKRGKAEPAFEPVPAGAPYPVSLAAAPSYPLH